MSNLLREYIVSILTERGQTLAPVALTNSQVKLQLTTAMRDLADVNRIECTGKNLGKDGHCRVFLNDLKEKSDDDLTNLATDSVALAFGGLPIVKNIGRVRAYSGTFDTYKVTDQYGTYSYNIIFTGGLTSGTRGGGYAYEGEIKRLLNAMGTTTEDVGADVKVSDIFIKIGRDKNVGIEVKKSDAKYGQPTLLYDYKNKSFLVPATSKSPDNAAAVASTLNAFVPKLSGWLNNIQNAWNELHSKAKMNILANQITPKDWEVMMVKFNVGQSGPKVPMDINQIVAYYKNKNAHYIQIENKGLYAFTDILNLGVMTFVDAAKGQEVFIKPEILLSGGKKVFRATISLNSNKLANSDMDLANPFDAQNFGLAIEIFGAAQADS